MRCNRCFIANVARTLALMMAIALSCRDRVVRAEEPSLEDKVKSAFILNFVQLVEWPDATFPKSDAPLVIGILDPNSIAEPLAKTIDGQTVKGHPIVIRHLSYPGDLSGCQVLIVSAQFQAKCDDIIKSLGGKPILTIGDPENFTSSGGMIRFYIEDRKERFEINKAAADRAGLQISSKLLKLAKVVNK